MHSGTDAFVLCIYSEYRLSTNAALEVGRLMSKVTRLTNLPTD